ncbi:MAG: Arylsulfatase precursor [Verrucomicrobiota bacterium]|jgi:arylsulfatase A-like enzyme
MKNYGLFFAVILGLLLATSPAAESSPQADRKPNIVFILVDDAGIGDFSAYGCKYGLTPNIDRLAAEGMKFSQAYSGSAVCAPSRCVLMTGQHTGHVLRRANQSKVGLLSLPADQPTVARMLHDAGYATGGFGKWGLGNPGTSGVAENQGFDVFFGYYDQKHAHDYYTDHLVRNSVDVPYQQSGKHTWEDYSHTRIADETLKFIEENKDRPFFCYAAWTPPHDEWVIPDNAPFSNEPWPVEIKNYAAMVSLVDKDVGRVMEKLKELGIDDNTLVIFSSDNGANDECIDPLGSTGGLRGYKRMLYEGGIRAPFIARWPGKIEPGTTSDVQTTFADFLPTAADLIGAPAPANTDGISILPTLLGQQQTKLHDALYFEIYEPYFQQSVRMGNWKGYRLGTKAPLELYDLKADPAEKNNLASAHPDIVKKIEAVMAEQHTPSPHYDAPEQSEKGSKKPGQKKKVKSVPEMLNEESAEPEPGSK